MAVGTRRVAKSIGMRIVVEVAVPTRRIDRLELAIRMAAHTFDTLVPANQRKSALRVVVESELVPAGILVAFGAGFPPKLAVVVILVTPDAVTGTRLPLLPVVALEADLTGVDAPQRPPCGHVLENRRLGETCCDVALLANSTAENSGRMRIRVARYAAGNVDGAETLLIEVALVTLDLLVHPGPRKTRFSLVIEAHVAIEDLPIDRIVTAHAV